MVHKLLKALYGLKQVSRQWYKRSFNFSLKKLDFEQINADHSIFILVVEINGPIMWTFVDDIKIMRPKNFGVISRLKEEFTAAFEMVEMGPISFYFGLNFCRDRNNKMIKLFLTVYIDKILA